MSRPPVALTRLPDMEAFEARLEKAIGDALAASEVDGGG